MYQDLLAVLALALKAQDQEVRSLRADVDRMKKAQDQEVRS
jgi:hypothetical protein